MQARDVMTPDPVVCPPSTRLTDAATLMRDRDIGDVLVGDGGRLAGIVTDRDLVVRGLASGDGAMTMTIGDICSGDVHAVPVDCAVEDVLRVMTDRGVRRVPVVDGGRPVGIISIGDLAQDRDPQSVLGQISSAPPQE